MMRKSVVFHAVAAVATVVLVTLPVVGSLLSPFDGLAPPRFSLVVRCEYLLAALTFYGFSFALLRTVPLPTWWSVAYTLTSGLFFLWAFYPILSSEGMMRRIAGTMEAYHAAQRSREQWHLLAMLIFASIQGAYLRYVLRQTSSTFSSLT